MKVTVIGTGYVGLVSGVCYAEIGHEVTCIDVNQDKIAQLRKGKSPIFEPNLEELMNKNIHNGKLQFTDNYLDGIEHAEVILIAVGTPCKQDGTADLQFVESVAANIALYIKKYAVIVIKSTVPVGTNHYIGELIKKNLVHDTDFDMVSNPEFLREGTAIKDTFNGDRIVLGSDSSKALAIVEELHKQFNIPYFLTDTRSAEMIKYAANAFLATKISFINEIAKICEKVGANVEDVALGMGKDKRIGEHFLKAGIGYGGSCFPKDTKALVQIAGNVEHDFELLRSVIKVNIGQQQALIEKAISYFGDLSEKKIAILGLSFKPNTDDMRDAASVVITDKLISLGASVIAYDPVTIENAKKILNPRVTFNTNINEVMYDADCVFILTEWDQIKQIDLRVAGRLMKNPVFFDGRNCFTLEEAQRAEIDYFSIGRSAVIRNFD
ncbi:UDP-glucose 6-dehydrogenase [Paenibacillus pectinilyticus]|uniref:UDP-glucose 6-dehydrogenase n=1 Tax=Paenibacillus pectinilyticus TaxID=512399 RepID=A0A1C0ZRM5_9BACL|nr:UDP-glucose/GDP-mannose dehydrogenase family protein [Paenibacillus pectinilyticus]OCT10705.1 UDP-glucose 6-dehydrogenase [Paenibacillus pectinilyticus]